jgi:hypothetical protein
MPKKEEKGFVRAKIKNVDSGFYDCKVMSKKECLQLLNFYKKLVQDQSNVVVELDLMSGAIICSPVSEVEHLIYIPEELLTKND